MHEFRGGRMQPPVDATTPLLQYEAQQPPLYYLLAAVPYAAIRGASLPARVYALRIFSMAIASLVIPLAIAIGRRVFPSERLAFAVAIAVACLPGLYIDMCRTGNESLAMVLTAATLLCGLRALERDAEIRQWVLLGCLLGAALLTKSYALAFLALLPVLGILRFLLYRESAGVIAARCMTAFAAAVLIAGGWYWHNWRVTGTLSGELMDVAANSFGLQERMAAFFGMRWGRVIDSMASTFLWNSGWSFLTVRSWMYRVFEIIGVGAMFGILAAPLKKQSGKFLAQTAFIAILPLMLCLAVAYQALAIHLNTGLTTGIGWYLYAGVSAEVVLLGLGYFALGGPRGAAAALAGTSALAVALDFYTVHLLLIPYYAGLIAHDPVGGRLGSFRGAGFGETAHRLSFVNGLAIPPTGIGILWAAYLCTTAALLLLALRGFAWRTGENPGIVKPEQGELAIEQPAVN
jgi:4-amino-4-deoxy-L-arabinose transferase and related glycosyltransferases of PMT family